MSREWIDISVPLHNGTQVWPGDTPVQIERVHAIERGDAYNLSAISMSVHAGTHMDAPLHFLDGRAAIDELPFDATVGPARVIELRELAEGRIERGARILFKTGGAPLSSEAAAHLVERGVRTVGIDGLSVGDDETHRTLLGAGIWIIEGLDLSAVEPGDYDLVCLPLRLQGAEGAPARAILRRRGAC